MTYYRGVGRAATLQPVGQVVRVGVVVRHEASQVPET